jgi:hypothetical protein
MDPNTIFLVTNLVALLLGGAPSVPWPHLSASHPAPIVCAE